MPDDILIDRVLLKKFLLHREAVSHKGDYGHLLLVCGCDAMPGAAVLSVASALKSGCGLVTLHTSRFAAGVCAVANPSAMLSIDEAPCFSSREIDLSRYNAVAAGPGLGRDARTADALESLVESALYAFGEHDALGFSPFSIEDAPVTSDSPLAGSYAVLRQIMPLVCSMRGTSDMRAVLFDSKDVSDTLEFADTRLVCSHFFTLPWDARATDGSPWPEAGAIIIRLAEDEFLIAGSGVVVEFMHQDELSARASRTAALGEDGFAAAGSGNGSDGKNGWTQGSVRLGIGFVEEVRLSPESGMETVRRLGGDQDHQGRHARIGVDGYSILHVKLYRYR